MQEPHQDTAGSTPIADETDTTRNWIPLTVLIISVPFMLGLFVFIGYLVCEFRHP